MLEGMEQVRRTIKAPDCSPENIFNSDETRLFYKSLPISTLEEVTDKRAGQKEDKKRVTVCYL
jgi:hypothetical protein